MDCTYNSSTLCGFDERQCAVIRLFRDVNKALFMFALLQQAVKLVQQANPLGSFVITVSQDQDGAFFIAGWGELWCCHLQERKRTTTYHRTWAQNNLLKLQYKTNVTNTNFSIKYSYSCSTHLEDTGNVLPVRMNDIWCQNWANWKLLVPAINRERVRCHANAVIRIKHRPDVCFEVLSDLMSITWFTVTPGWAALPSGRSYKKSLKSQTTAMALCHPFFTPNGLGT